MKKIVVSLMMFMILIPARCVLAIDLAATPNQLSPSLQNLIRNNLNAQVNLGATEPSPGIFSWSPAPVSPSNPVDSFWFDSSGNLELSGGQIGKGKSLSRGNRIIPKRCLSQRIGAHSFLREPKIGRSSGNCQLTTDVYYSSPNVEPKTYGRLHIPNDIIEIINIRGGIDVLIHILNESDNRWGISVLANYGFLDVHHCKFTAILAVEILGY